MTRNVYYETMDAMEKAGVEREYMDGWACGWLHNPRRGEQYLTEAYEAGYQDGFNQVPDRWRDFVTTCA